MPLLRAALSQGRAPGAGCPQEHPSRTGGLLLSFASTSQTLSNSEPAHPLAPRVPLPPTPPHSALASSLGIPSSRPAYRPTLVGEETAGQQQSSVSSKAGQPVGCLQGQGLPCPLSSLMLGQSMSVCSSRKEEPSNGRGISLRCESPWLRVSSKCSWEVRGGGNFGWIWEEEGERAEGEKMTGSRRGRGH